MMLLLDADARYALVFTADACALVWFGLERKDYVRARGIDASGGGPFCEASDLLLSISTSLRNIRRQPAAASKAGTGKAEPLRGRQGGSPAVSRRYVAASWRVARTC